MTKEYLSAYVDNLKPKINVANVNFTIPDGGYTRFVTATGANAEITLPALANSIGAIYYITAENIGGLTIKCNAGDFDILNRGVTYDTFTIDDGSDDGAAVQIINNGINYILFQLTP